MGDVGAESMVGGTTFRREMIFARALTTLAWNNTTGSARKNRRSSHNDSMRVEEVAFSGLH
jgi:hypothetical protein